MSTDELQANDFFETDADSAQENKFLLCRIGTEIFGIDIQHVTDILELQKITEIPDMPEYVKGVINLRGRVIPVIDMRIRFGFEPKEYDDRNVITVVDIKGYSTGFIVDTTTEVQHISEKNIDPPPFFIENGTRNSYIAGLGKIENLVVIILNIESLVGTEEIKTMQDNIR